MAVNWTYVESKTFFQLESSRLFSTSERVHNNQHQQQQKQQMEYRQMTKSVRYGGGISHLVYESAEMEQVLDGMSLGWNKSSATEGRLLELEAEAEQLLAAEGQADSNPTTAFSVHT